MILRHFDTHTPEQIAAMPHFDGFVWQEGHPVEAIASELGAQRRGWMYYNVLTMPPWPDPLPTYLAFIRDRAPRLVHPLTGEPILYYGRGLIDYSIATTAYLIDMALCIKQVLDAHPNQYGAFLDNTFPRIMPWMMSPEEYALFPPEKWILGEANFLRFLDILEALDIQVLCNGDREVPRTLYCEYANLSWNGDLTIWRNDRPSDQFGSIKLQHVLSVEALDEAAVDRVISNHRYTPSRWIAFSTRTSEPEALAAIEAAYRLAAL